MELNYLGLMQIVKKREYIKNMVLKFILIA